MEDELDGIRRQLADLQCPRNYDEKISIASSSLGGSLDKMSIYLPP